MMEPFIRNDQYNFIRNQIQILINGHASVNDKAVLQAVKSLAMEKVLNLFTDLSHEQKQLLQPIIEITAPQHAEEFLSQLKPYLIPFKGVSEQAIRKLFRKVKKLKMPALKNIDPKELSYLGWDDLGSQKKYIVAYYNQKLIGLHGTFSPHHKKGFCALCHKFEEIGMFMIETKGMIEGTFTRKGNTICQDSQKCNHNITSLSKLEDFISFVLLT